MCWLEPTGYELQPRLGDRQTFQTYGRFAREGGVDDSPRRELGRALGGESWRDLFGEDPFEQRCRLFEARGQTRIDASLNELTEELLSASNVALRALNAIHGPAVGLGHRRMVAGLGGHQRVERFKRSPLKRVTHRFMPTPTPAVPAPPILLGPMPQRTPGRSPSVRRPHRRDLHKQPTFKAMKAAVEPIDRGIEPRGQKPALMP